VTVGAVAGISKNVGALLYLSHPVVVAQDAPTGHGCKDYIDVD